MKWVLIYLASKVGYVLVFFALKVVWPRGAGWLQEKTIQPLRFIWRFVWRPARKVMVRNSIAVIGAVGALALVGVAESAIPRVMNPWVAFWATLSLAIGIGAKSGWDVWLADQGCKGANWVFDWWERSTKPPPDVSSTRRS